MKISNQTILYDISNGVNYAKAIADAHSVTVAAITKRLKGLCGKGYVKQDEELTKRYRALHLNSAKLYSLTGAGKQYLLTYNRGEVPISSPQVNVDTIINDSKEVCDVVGPRLVGVHNITYKYNVYRSGGIDWGKCKELNNNVIVNYGHIGDVYIEENRTCILVKFSIKDIDVNSCSYHAYKTAIGIKAYLEEAGYDIGYPLEVGKWKWEIKNDPVSSALSPLMNYVSTNGEIDNTPFNGCLHKGTLEDVEDYLLMGQRIKEMYVFFCSLAEQLNSGKALGEHREDEKREVM